MLVVDGEAMLAVNGEAMPAVKSEVRKNLRRVKAVFSELFMMSDIPVDLEVRNFGDVIAAAQMLQRNPIYDDANLLLAAFCS